MQKWTVFHLISKHLLNMISFVFSLWIINEFEFDEKLTNVNGKTLTVVTER